MTTILPEKNKKDNRKQYMFGFLERLFISFIVVSVIFIVLETTVYYSISFEKKVLENNFIELKEKEKTEVFKEYKDLIDESKKLIKTFSVGDVYKKEIIDFVFGLEDENITISFVSVEKIDENIVVRLNGISKNREALFNLKSGLESESFVSDIQLPVSSFAKTFDIPFSVTFNYEYEK